MKINSRTTQQIRAARPARNPVVPEKPYAFFVEKEHNASGAVVDVATLLLTNAECPFTCLMCDLWKNTLPRSGPEVSIANQIRTALGELPLAREIKLYNSGNFFDPKAIPRHQYGEIAELVRRFDTVIVENHPKLCGDECKRFRDLIAPAQLEIALGLETCHPEVLAALNKDMTLTDFDRATDFLNQSQIRTRAFVLLRPPFMNEAEGIEWAERTVTFAFDRGVSLCAVIPTRAGNGIMEQLELEGHFSPPEGDSMEQILSRCLEMKRGRVTIDLWDAERFFSCENCRVKRIQRLQNMNLTQMIEPSIECAECRS
ncbi:radical SAM protein [Thalassoglobus neptunius]|nr:radical SAM protein [Thalassoglobus neptunius]